MVQNSTSSMIQCVNFVSIESILNNSIVEIIQKAVPEKADHPPPFPAKR
jgi:hypothetical protein